MTAQKIGALLGTAELDALSRKARRLAQLQRVFSRCATHPLTHASRVSDYRAGTLFVTADNAAVATKLKQLAPSLLSNIQKREPEITGIKIVLQVKDVTTERNDGPLPGKPRIENIEVFRELAHKLPDSSLKAAVDNLVRRHGRRRPSDGQ